MPAPFVTIAAGVLVDEPGDALDNQRDEINSTQHCSPRTCRAPLALTQKVSQEPLKLTLRRGGARPKETQLRLFS